MNGYNATKGLGDRILNIQMQQQEETAEETAEDTLIDDDDLGVSVLDVDVNESCLEPEKQKDESKHFAFTFFLRIFSCCAIPHVFY